MPRVKRGTIGIKKRRTFLKLAKGYHLGRKSKEKEAKQAIIRAGANALAHRRKKKREFRKLWNIKINAGVREHGMSYSRFIDALTKKDIALNRKILAGLAEHEPETFKRVFDTVTK